MTLSAPSAAASSAGDEVGVDVEAAAVVAGGHRGDDRDEAVLDEVVDDGGVDRGHVADAAEPRVALRGA